MGLRTKQSNKVEFNSDFIPLQPIKNILHQIIINIFILRLFPPPPPTPNSINYIKSMQLTRAKCPHFVPFLLSSFKMHNKELDWLTEAMCFNKIQWLFWNYVHTNFKRFTECHWNLKMTSFQISTQPTRNLHCVYNSVFNEMSKTKAKIEMHCQ